MDTIIRRLEAIKARAAEIRSELDDAEEVLSAEDVDEDTITATSGHIDELEAEAEALADERSSLETKLEKRQRLADAAKDLPVIRGDAPQVHTSRVEDPAGEIASRAWSPRPDDVRALRDAAQKAIAETDEWELDDTNKAHLAKLARNDSHISRLLIATGSDVYKRAFAKAVVGNHYLMDADEQRAIMRAMSLSDAAGGYAVPFPIDPTLIITGDGSTNPVRSVARVVQITSDSWQGVSAGATSFSWDGEAAEVSDDTSTFAQPSVPVHKAQGFVPFSIEIGMDYPGMADELGRLFAEGKNDLEAVAFITGNGSDKPTGIVTAIDGTGNDVSSATTDVFAVADVYTAHETVGPRYRNRATWLANIAIINDIRAFGTNDASFTVTLADDQPPRVMGRPILEASAMDGSITALADNNVLVFGDFSNYVIADRAGFNLELVPHLFATANNLPSGQRGWYAWWRTGGDSVNDDAFALLNVT